MTEITSAKDTFESVLFKNDFFFVIVGNKILPAFLNREQIVEFCISILLMN